MPIALPAAPCYFLIATPHYKRWLPPADCHEEITYAPAAHPRHRRPNAD
jgi:hypothetical protein